MKAIGIVREIDKLGRVVIPKEVRKTQGWEEGQPMEMFMDGDALILKAYRKDSERSEIKEQLNKLLESNSSEVRTIAKNAIEFIERG